MICLSLSEVYGAAFCGPVETLQLEGRPGTQSCLMHSQTKLIWGESLFYMNLN